jgi:hypothetical protein
MHYVKLSLGPGRLMTRLDISENHNPVYRRINDQLRNHVMMHMK